MHKLKRAKKVHLLCGLTQEEVDVYNIGPCCVINLYNNVCFPGFCANTPPRTTKAVQKKKPGLLRKLLNGNTNGSREKRPM